MRARVLIVDDDEVYLDGMKELLEEAGYEVFLATSFEDGRLKLRETVGRRAELIAYDRPDHADVRASDYDLISIDDPATLKRGLARTLGVRVVVVKRRELLMWYNVRIHLDRVEGLGSFVEFEAVISEGEDEATGHERVAMLAEALRLRDEDRIATSYSNLIEAARRAV